MRADGKKGERAKEAASRPLYGQPPRSPPHPLVAPRGTGRACGSARMRHRSAARRRGHRLHRGSIMKAGHRRSAPPGSPALSGLGFPAASLPCEIHCRDDRGPAIVRRLDRQQGAERQRAAGPCRLQGWYVGAACVRFLWCFEWVTHPARMRSCPVRERRFRTGTVPIAVAHGLQLPAASGPAVLGPDRKRFNRRVLSPVDSSAQAACARSRNFRSKAAGARSPGASAAAGGRGRPRSTR